MTVGNNRAKDSFGVKADAAYLARSRKYSKRETSAIRAMEMEQPVIHETNDDEKLVKKPMSFTKGLPHSFDTGLIKSEDDFQQFVAGIESGNPSDFRATPLGPSATMDDPSPDISEDDWISPRGKATKKVRAWESAGAGTAFDLQGPDAQAVTMPPPPALGSSELTAELGEVYAQAILRDLPFDKFNENSEQFKKAVDALTNLNWFKDFNRRFVNNTRLARAKLNYSNVFRGSFRGDGVGPYISQFLLMGNRGLNTSLPGSDSPSDFEHKVDEGFITFGALRIDQRVRVATKNVDYLTDWNEWFDAQNGADFRRQELYDPNDQSEETIKRRFITTPRDLATYVHYDALYEAYLNACLILLDAKLDTEVFRFDTGVPFKEGDSNDHQQGFALYGGPHILTLVTEVATRALKAVRYQKFNSHLRSRPEVLAARMHKLSSLNGEVSSDAYDKFKSMHDELETAGIFELFEDSSNKLLPMAFAEGSPMHPSYGAGHATVAGACVTILKAFFDHRLYLSISDDGASLKLTNDKNESKNAFVSSDDGSCLEIKHTEPLTLEGELNKVAANISIGRDWAGVHYYSDYVESMLMGEEIAIGMLQEQSLTYNQEENFLLTLPKFDGTTVIIQNGNVKKIKE